MRNRKTEGKIIQNRRTAKKLVQNRKPHTKKSKANKMVISEAYNANYANSYFIKVIVNVMDFSETLVSFSFCRLLSSLFAFNINLFFFHNSYCLSLPRDKTQQYSQLLLLLLAREAHWKLTK